MLSKEALEDFKKIWREQFGEDISNEDAMEQATRLLNICRVVFQPMPKAWEKRYNELLRGRAKKKKANP